MPQRRRIAFFLLACFVMGGFGGPMAHWSLNLHESLPQAQTGARHVHADPADGPLITGLGHPEWRQIDCWLCATYTAASVSLSEAHAGARLALYISALFAQNADGISLRDGLIRGPPVG